MSVRPTKSLVVSSAIALLAGLTIWSLHSTARAQTTVAAQAATQAGPALGDTIDLLSWRDQKGRTLAEANSGHSLALVALVNPTCDSCMKTRAAMQALQERATKANIAYYVLMMPDGTDSQTNFAYADSLKIEAGSFVWSNADVKPPAALLTMPVPSHLLLTNEGLVVNKWTGTPSSIATQ